MIELGKKQVLTVCRTTDHGVYVGEKEEKGQAVLLPRKLVPEGTAVGDSLEAVSYTHLDVYKRQIRMCGAAPIPTRPLTAPASSATFSQTADL